MKKQMKKGLEIVLALVMVFAMTATAFAQTTDDNITVYVTVERTLVGNQSLILEPTAVTVPVGTSVLGVLDALKSSVSGFDYTYSGTVAAGTAYVKGFKVASHGSFNYLTDYEFWNQYDTAASGMGSVYFEYGTTPSSSDLFLEAGDYNMLGGWIVSANNTITWDDTDTTENEAYPTASTILTSADNGLVLRFEYSFALARDAGYTGFSLLDLTTLESPFYTAANKSELIKEMANCTDKTSTAYTNGRSVLMDMDATQSAVNSAVQQF